MATRRTIPSEFSQASLPEKPAYNQTVSQISSRKSNTSPAVPTSVVVKLLGFSLAMIALPLGTYFATVETVFRGSTTWAGASAAIMANVVLIGYIVAAMMEDQSEQIEAKKVK